MDEETSTALRATLREILGAGHGPAQTTRLLTELGWDEVATAEPRDAVPLLFEEAGRACAGLSALQSTLAPLLDGLVPELPRGLAVALPVAPARSVVVGASDAAALVVAGESGQARVVEVPPGALVPVAGIDRELEALALGPGTGFATTTVVAAETWTAVLGLARRCLASALVGVGTGALALAERHVAVRHQFGRPIGAFQAVRHRLAEARVQIDAARELIGVAWDTAGDVDGAATDSAATDSLAAACAAGRAADLTVRVAMQVHGAIGLTAEHPLHRYVRRAAALDLLAGGTEAGYEELGRRLAAGATKA